jgi:hypothetical protein
LGGIPFDSLKLKNSEKAKILKKTHGIIGLIGGKPGKNHWN